MIKRVEVHGYQSLYKVGFDLGLFTVIYGESDVGKSALYRAIRGMVSGESGDSFISKGRKACKVGIVLDTGETVAWVKKETKSGEYVFKAGEDSDIQYFKRSRRLPMEIAKTLRFGEIQIDSDRFFPNFHGQFDPLFLLFESSGKRARLLGSLISNVLLRGIRQANIERNRNEADVRSLDGLISEIDRKKAFDWDDISRRVKSTKKTLATVLEAKSKRIELERLLSRRTTFEKLATFKAKPMTKKRFTDLDKLFQSYTKLHDLLFDRKGTVDGIAAFKEHIETQKGLLKEWKTHIKKMEKKLVFQCPHCGKDISKLEIDI
jgi:energy-coupling factor transporter ATP-binding protein EcfA2